ncbi:hypothetical protein ACQ4LE_005914 [Meloidogyne hapla]
MSSQKFFFVLIASLMLINLFISETNAQTKYIDCQCAKNLCNYPCKSSKSACDGCKNTDVPKQCTINQCTIP